jgi:hypothetical protein
MSNFLSFLEEHSRGSELAVDELLNNWWRVDVEIDAKPGACTRKLVDTCVTTNLSI